MRLSHDEESPMLADMRGGSQRLNVSWLSPLRLKIFLSVGFAIVLAVILVFTLVEFDEDDDVESSEKYYTNGVVAADQPTCSKMGADILRIGGNAVDAAVTTSLCLGLLNPFASGIGGGGFMLIRPPTGEPQVIDYREIAPANSSREMFFDKTYSSTEGGRAVAVPSELRGLELAYKRFGSGRVLWKDLVLPVAKVAEDGFVITQIFEDRIKETEETLKRWSKIYSVMAPNGVFLRKGDILKRPDLAELFRIIAEQGAEAFYTGVVADDILSAVNANQGNMTQDDLDAAIPVVRTPLKSTYHGLTVYGAPPPSSGGVAMGFTLSVLDRYDLRQNGKNGENVHRIVESLKFSFAQRTLLGDPAFIPEALEVVDRLYSEEYQSAVFRNITDETHEPEYYVYEPTQIARDHGTSHFSVTDKDKMAVACTTTINLTFGSKLMTEKFGILLNDQMDDFATSEENAFGIPFSESNRVEPRKKPLSSMSPTVLVDANNNLRMVVGASGGPRIISAVLNVILNILDFDEPVESAVTVPRFHHQWLPEELLVERGFDSDLVADLTQRKHKIDIADNLPDGHTLGNVQVIRVDGERMYAASDPRKQGLPDGF
eukprot:TRINITY_DN4404_c0_g1_i1.p1 TRINITY_DN4404_c0_g1~~TRINITY_DN4404_c0_g1_i1.p1  ORF type:complete len:602 (-),score=129.33 TRINITY_DN4404_c0_g1_i1:88-1893(-)